MEENEMTFWGHLEALRWVLVRVVAVLFLFMIASFCFMPYLFEHVILAPTTSDFPLYQWLAKLGSLGPFFPDFSDDNFHVEIININVASQFMTHISTSFWFALVLIFPYLVFEIWKFIQPALFENERKNVGWAFCFGTGMFQFMLTIGLVFAALVGLGFSMHVDAVKAAGGDVFGAMEFAWKAIFWACAVPGVIFTLGAFAISESPRWLFGKGRKDAALAALARSRGPEAAEKELAEMGSAIAAEAEAAKAQTTTHKDSLLQKKYVVPFILAVVILACNQATGINSVLAYIVDVLRQAGLDGAIANWGDLTVKILNMVMTLVAMFLVDRLGRKALLTIGTTGIIIGLLGVAFLFLRSEPGKDAEFASAPNVQAAVKVQTLKEPEVKAGAETGKMVDNTYDFVATLTPGFICEATGMDAKDFPKGGMQVKIVYEQDGEMGMKTVVVKPLEPSTGVVATTLDTAMEDLQAKVAEANKKSQEWADSLTVKIPLQERKAGWWDKLMNKVFGRELPSGNKEFVLKQFRVGELPSPVNGWLVTAFFAIFIATYAIGPGVCVWLALSELMPTRIRAVGMSVALLINQGVSTVIAGTFLPVVGNWGYATIFFFCAGCTVIYWITAVFFLPETKGRTLEEIEAYFEGRKKLD